MARKKAEKKVSHKENGNEKSEAKHEQLQLFAAFREYMAGAGSIIGFAVRFFHSNPYPLSPPRGLPSFPYSPVASPRFLCFPSAASGDFFACGCALR